MQNGRLAKERSGHKRRRPHREVRDLLKDFGTARRWNGSLWLTLDSAKLPDYLRKTRVAQEARRWVGVFSAGGRISRYLERSSGVCTGLQSA